jgi:hypothetical protein
MWKKVKFKSFSQSEWQCLTCGETSYAPHGKSPVNCLRRVFGVNIRQREDSKKSRFNKITALKFGGYGLSVFLVVFFIALLVAFSHFKCRIYLLVGIESSVCISVALIDEIYNDDAAEGLRQTDASNDICSGFDYVDYADVEEYLGMLRREIQFLDNAIDGKSQEYQKAYSDYYLMSEIHNGFYKGKIDKCFAGDDGSRLSLEVTRLHNFAGDKARILYELAQK